MKLKICSFNVSKQLKEKGFDIPVLMCYEWMEHKTHLCQNIQEKGKLENWNSHTGEENDYVLIFYSAPTLDLIFKWLRDDHNILIWITKLINDKMYQFEFSNGEVMGSGQAWESYEKAQEKAIIEVLKLIK